ncbi:MAG: FAD-dependent monooxygenase [Nitriliruptorales bacterium]|nr:FAD-dependent monooxygenase [Nitriliruptorales bacterium]
MRFGVIGGGPAGLYFSILMKQADPSHEITVVEQNPAGATYGWGVVFSVDTLSELRDADYGTWLEIDDHIVRWDALDIRYRDRDIRAYGHGFSAISRKVLLQLLQQRAADLGVELRFEEEVDGPDAFPDAEVIVAADGVHSKVRTALEEELGTETLEHPTRFVWFGADLAFDAFTFIFRETDHGLFTVHSYPFDESTSTFIVEVTEDTWRNAGLDQMTEDESLAFCQDLFADHLGGADLLSNKSIWRQFTTVRNRHWHHGNVVLVGDAVATAHFTIGSGTKLAMEDAVALSKAFVAHGDDLSAVFSEYESERQIPTERFQQAAIDSADYFANVSRYVGFAPEPFTMNLLTRSGRITHADVEARDPTIANRVDRWFHEDAVGADPSDRVVVPRPSAVPLQLAEGLELPNRVVATQAPRDDSSDGVVGEGTRAALVGAAGLGAGLVVTEPVAVSAHGRITLGSPGLYEEEHVATWRKVVDELHDAGTRVALRLSHSGRRGSMRPREGGLDRPLRGADRWTTLAPSPIPYTSTTPAPAAVDAQRFGDVRDDFAAAARAARDAGFDLLLLDWSDGYLLASFLSPLTNQRDDEFGGDLDGRMRWPLQVLDTVKGEWGGALGVRLVMDDRVRGGLSPDDGVEIARRLGERGVGVIDAVAGHTVPRGGGEYRRLYRVPLADRARNEAGVRSIASGAITTLDQIDTVVSAGRADLCLLDPSRYQQPRIR